MPNRLVRYAGAPRSGNHALGAMLKARFYRSYNIGSPMLQQAGVDFHGIAGIGYCEWAGLLAGHPIEPASDIDVYIVRDVADVLESLWWLRTRGSLEFGAFLRTPLDCGGGALGFSPPAAGGITPVERIAWTRRSWRPWPGLVVRYEDLAAEDTREYVLTAIQARLSLEPDPIPAFDPLARYGYFVPNRPTVAWAPEDVALVEDACKESIR